MLKISKIQIVTLCLPFDVIPARTKSSKKGVEKVCDFFLRYTLFIAVLACSFVDVYIPEKL